MLSDFDKILNPHYIDYIPKLKRDKPTINKEGIFDDLLEKLLTQLDQNYPPTDSNSPYKSVIVESRWTPQVEFTIKNTIKNLPDNWDHIVFCTNGNFSDMMDLNLSLEGRLKLINLGDFKIDRNSYNNLCLTTQFWKQIGGEKILIYQSDTFIFKKFDTKFLEWDYIGAPWGPSNHSEIVTKLLKREKEILLGNGGLSLRTTRAMIDILENNKPRKNIVDSKNETDLIWEDLFFSDAIERSRKWKLAPVEIAKEFSFELEYQNDTFGCHRPYSNYSSELVFNKFLSNFFGVNIFGFLNKTSSLGHNARMVLEAVKSAKIHFNIKVMDNETSDFWNYTSSDFCYFPINLFLVNGNFDLNNCDVDLNENWNIALWTLEIESVPPSWKKWIDKLDEIWVPSRFCKSAIESEYPNKLVKVINLPGQSMRRLDKNLSKAELDLSGKFVVLFVFDSQSDFLRKNPEAAIISFQKSLAKWDNTILIIKAQNLSENELHKLQSIACEGVIIINEVWSFKKMETLFNSADIYLSLHRSEGFGLTILEALSLGIPTIATGWSGNLDFMTSGSLVEFDFVEVQKESRYGSIYRYSNFYWAEANIQDAADKLEDVYLNYSKWQNRAKRDSKDLLQKWSLEVLKKQIVESLSKIKLFEVS